MTLLQQLKETGVRFQHVNTVRFSTTKDKTQKQGIISQNASRFDKYFSLALSCD